MADSPETTEAASIPMARFLLLTEYAPIAALDLDAVPRSVDCGDN